MPDITIPNVFSDGSPADAEQVSENTYLPKDIASIDNPEVINGKLTNPNRDGWSIDSQDVRRGHFSDSRMVSATANQDFFDDVYLGQAVSGFPTGTWWEDAQVIPGCAVTFYVPWTVRAVSLTWHLTAVVDAAVADVNSATNTIKRYDGAGDPYSISGLPAPYYDEGPARLMLFINDLPVFPVQRFLLNGAASMAYDLAEPQEYYNEYYAPDTRDWSGSFLFDVNTGAQLSNFLLTQFPIFRGWHTADIRLVFPAYDTAAAATDGTGGIKQVRVKTRRMGYTIIR